MEKKKKISLAVSGVLALVFFIVLVRQQHEDVCEVNAIITQEGLVVDGGNLQGGWWVPALGFGASATACGLIALW